MDAASPAIFPPRGVLVAFATKHRSAGEIARTIAAGLAEADLEVDVLPVEQVERMTATKPWSWAAVCTSTIGYGR